MITFLILILNLGLIICDDLYYLEGTVGGNIGQPDYVEGYKALVASNARKYNANKSPSSTGVFSPHTNCISDGERINSMRYVWQAEHGLLPGPPGHTHSGNLNLIDPDRVVPEKEKIWFFKWVNVTLLEGSSSYESNYGNDIYTYVEFTRPCKHPLLKNMCEGPDQYTRYAFETATKPGHAWRWGIWWYWNWADVSKDKVTMDIIKSERLTTAHDIVITYWDYSRLGADHKVSQCRLNLGEIKRKPHSEWQVQICYSPVERMEVEIMFRGELDKDLPAMAIDNHYQFTTLLGWPLQGYCNEKLGPVYGVNSRRSLRPGKSRKQHGTKYNLRELIAAQDPYAIFTADWFKKNKKRR